MAVIRPRRFGGVTYYPADLSWSKEQAEDRAEELRSEGFRAKVTVDPNDSTYYRVWTRPRAGD